MATYKGHDIAPPDRADEDLRLRGGRAPGMENIEEELNLPEDQRLDHIRRPGEKGYMETKPMADKKETPRQPPQPPGWIKAMPEGGSATTRDPAAFERLKSYGQSVGTKVYFRGPNQWEYLQNRDEPESVDSYSTGGKVKYGSSTRVSCKHK